MLLKAIKSDYIIYCKSVTYLVLVPYVVSYLDYKYGK